MVHYQNKDLSRHVAFPPLNLEISISAILCSSTSQRESHAKQCSIVKSSPFCALPLTLTPCLLSPNGTVLFFNLPLLFLPPIPKFMQKVHEQLQMTPNLIRNLYLMQSPWLPLSIMHLDSLNLYFAQLTGSQQRYAATLKWRPLLLHPLSLTACQSCRFTHTPTNVIGEISSAKTCGYSRLWVNNPQHQNIFIHKNSRWTIKNKN